jgi:hypothetical protein
MNLDGYMILENFLEFCTSGLMSHSFNLFNKNNDDLEKAHFNLMDTKQKGTVAWVDFALFYSSKLIARKNKVKNFFFFKKMIH